jgi:hypothetical protein
LQTTTRLWARIVTGHRIVRQATAPCLRDDPQPALMEVLKELDLSRPVWLPKHQREWDDFGQTRFTQEHFMESIPFDRLEIEYINPDAPKRKSQDPRNEA